MRLLTFAALVLGLTFAVSPARSDEAKPADPPAKFKGKGNIPGSLSIATGFSPDKLAVTVLFDNLQSSVGGAKRPLLNTKTVTVSLPVETTADARITQDVRGYVSVQGKGRAVLIVQAAGTTTVVDLEKARVNAPMPVADGPNKQSLEGAKAQLDARGLTGIKKPGGASDFYYRIDATIKAGSSYQATFILLTERDADGDANAAHVVVDSFDVAIVGPAPAKP